MHVLVLEIKNLLKNLDAWLDKAVDHATGKKFDANTLLEARLAPDMLPLAASDPARLRSREVVRRAQPPARRRRRMPTPRRRSPSCEAAHREP